MSIEPQLLNKGEEVLQLFKKGAEFTQELLKENERLRFRILELESSSVESPAIEEEVTDQNRRLLEKVIQLERDKEEILSQISIIEAENSDYSKRYAVIEEENNTLASLYLASYQLHCTLNFKEVTEIIADVMHKLIGVDSFAVFLADESLETLEPVYFAGNEKPFPITESQGLIWKAAVGTEDIFLEYNRDIKYDYSNPLVVLQLKIKENIIGVIAVVSMAESITIIDIRSREMLTLLAGQAATAFFASRLYMESTNRLNTIKGFLDLLTQN